MMRPTGIRRVRGRWPATARAALACAVAGALAGCAETGMDARADLKPAAPRLVANAGVSPAGARVALVGLAGAPEPVAARFREALGKALAGRDVAAVDAAQASYLVQGHLGAWPAESGVAVSWVWDVFDARKQRLRRLEDRLVVRAAGADPWQAVDQRVLDSVAGRSADELAAFLTHTPEAVAAAPAAAAAAPARRAEASAPGPALSYAPLR